MCNDNIKANSLMNYPELLKEWDYDKNIIKPVEIARFSNKKVWWACKEGHKWETSPSNKNGCPYCTNKKVLEGYNDLATTNPKLLKEWNYKRNIIKPTEITKSSKKKIWWGCSNGHQWITSPSDKRDCPYCTNKKVLEEYNDLATTNPELLKEWNYNKNIIKPTEVTKGSDKKVWWICKKNHEWKTSISHRTSGRNCPKCSSSKKISFPEKAVYFYLKQIFPDAIENYKNKNILGKRELDIYIPSFKLAIEYDGKYYHNNETKDKIKDEICKKHDITLIRIVEKEPKDKNNKFIIFREFQTDISLNNAIESLIHLINNIFNKNINIDVDVASDKINILEMMNLNEVKSSIKNTPLEKEWNYNKNGTLKPEMFSKNSNKKVWWKCKKGHEWEASLSRRNRGNKCPICCNQKVLKGYNDLATTSPELLKEWDYNKNTLKPTEVTKGSHKKVWWKCNLEHKWEAVIHDRVKGNSCPYCNNQKVLIGYNDLATTSPELLKEWNYKRNIIKPTEVVKGSNKKVWWICEKGHEWKASVSQKNNCSICINQKVLEGYNDLTTTNLELLKEWNYKKNTMKPTEVTKGSNKKVWWVCNKKHEWKANISDRCKGINCPYCSNRKVLVGYNDLATTNPRLLKEWNYKRNIIKPTEVVKGSNKKIWWICSKGHEWKTAVSERNRGRGCLKCSKSSRTSFPEKAIYFYLKKIFPNAIENYKNPNLGKYELDIFISELNTGIEYDGAFYHKDTKRDNDKNNIIKQNNISLIRVREPECPKLSFNPNIIYIYLKDTSNESLNEGIRLILSYLGIDNKCLKIDINKDRSDILDLFYYNKTDVFTFKDYPNLLNEWNTEKNKNLKITQFTEKSNQKVWWICSKNHEWEATLYNRTSGKNCPYCSNKKVLVGYNDLATTNSELIKEWDFKTNIIKPTEVTKGSHKKAWWICSNNHNWEAKIEDRAKGIGCAICSRKKIEKGYNDLKTLYPNIYEELVDKDILKDTCIGTGSKNKFRWKCNKGHTWMATVSDRTKGQYCPYCANRKVLAGYNDLATTNSELIKEWNYTKNTIKPTEITKGSSQKAWWICEKGHEWEATISKRTSGRNCPYCANKKILTGYNDLATKNPELLKEWNYNKNTIKPTEVTKSSDKKVWWKCNLGHEWKAVISHRSNGTNCPYCSNQKVLEGYNDLATTNPEIIKEWDYDKNITKPTEVTKSSGKKVWWKCKYNHEWKTTIDSRNKGRSCPYCSNKKVLKGYNDLATTNPELTKEWNYNKNSIKPTEVTKCSNKKIWWKCSKGHEWEVSINSKGKCPVCCNQKVLKGYNDLATTNPELLKDWDYNKNIIKPTEITKGSNKKAWWKCSKCNHEYERVIAYKVKNPKCPSCKYDIIKEE